MKKLASDAEQADALPSSELVGAEISVTSRDLHVLVHEPAESVSPQRSNDRAGGWGVQPAGGR